MKNPITRPVEILLAEDNPGDVRLMREALEAGRVLNNLHVVTNGADVMPFLCRQEPYANAPRPDIIMLDLNLPKKSGHQVLAEIKTNEYFRRIPVIILTTSESEEDIRQAYSQHANCYITKPFDLDKFFQVIHSLEEFWFSIVTLSQE